jgi:hypothetical protein
METEVRVTKLPPMAQSLGYRDMLHLKKGIPWTVVRYEVPWAYAFYSHGKIVRAIFTVWDEDLGPEASPPEVMWTQDDPPRPKFVCDQRDGWQDVPKGITCIKIAKQAMTIGLPVEVVLIRGRRRNHTGRSKLTTKGCRVEDDRYYMKFTHVDDSGLLLADFIHKDKVQH